MLYRFKCCWKVGSLLVTVAQCYLWPVSLEIGHKLIGLCVGFFFFFLVSGFWYQNYAGEGKQFLVWKLFPNENQKDDSSFLMISEFVIYYFCSWF